MEAAFDVKFIAEHTRDVILHVRADGHLAYVSPSIARYGYAPEAFVGRTGVDMLHPDDHQQVREQSQALRRGEVEGQRAWVYRLENLRDGGWAWLEGNPRILRDEDGVAIGYVDILRDITERRALEIQAQDHANLFEAAFQYAAVGKALVGLDGSFLRLNPAFCRLVGYDEATLLTLDFQTITHPDDLEADLEELTRLTAGLSLSYQMRKRYLRSDGEMVWAHLTVSMVRNPDGSPKHYVAQVLDVTEQVAQAEALQQARADAEAAARIKSQFLANMSHEIRTPLTAVLGFTGLLRDDPTVTGDAAEHVERIAGAGAGLLSIVNDVLDFSKLEAGLFEIRPRPTPIQRLCQETVDIFSNQAAAKGLSLTFEAEPDLPAAVLVDGDRLRQTLINLIGNAVKFTDTGSVDVRLQVGGADILEVSVADTGPGLSCEAQQQLFQRFTQIDGSTTRRHGGTGLGLAISRGFAEAMGGAIHLVSAPGAGACFTVRLPAPPAVTLEADAEGPYAIDGLRVLVAEDNPANLELISRLLDAAGVEVITAEDGEQALERLALTPVDVVLMDIRMPRVDGRTAVARLRAVAGPNREVPVLAFTAEADDDGEAGFAAFDGVVRKPIDPLALLRQIDHAVGGPSAALDQVPTARRA